MQQTWAELRTQLNQALPAVRPYIPLLYIWGIQWIFQAFIGLLDDGSFPAWLSFALVAIAAALSALVIAFAGKPEKPLSLSWTNIRRFALPYLLFAAIALLLFSLEVVERYFFPLFQGLVLSLFYMKLGLVFRRVFLYLGLWLLTLSIVIAWAYLGFLPFVISSMGGCSLIVCGLLLRLDCRIAARQANNSSIR
ncbi:hypothetical protein [Paenibacillus senegalensis]|uniref:hypothetical protein n=1 Tax=Paenibacillus senegalensis TaxID=1465766 RepID=UPI000287DC6C|nr:hypothetical protein [Paenibacillus senegalensis]